MDYLLHWHEPVNTFSDLPENPIPGYAVSISDEKISVFWNGCSWSSYVVDGREGRIERKLDHIIELLTKEK